jgi:periplasmic protein TonB
MNESVRLGPPRLSRNAVVAGSVVLFHIAALWALQTGLVRRAIEIVIPATLLSEMISPPAPKEEPPVPMPKPPAPVTRKIEPRLPTPPQPVAIADTTAPNAPVGAIEPQPPAPPIAAAVAPAPVAAAAAPTASPKVELPSSDADYLQNPKPAYPPISKRLGEQGSVVVRVLIGTDGTAQRAEIRKSSGFERLDQSALATVLKWRYVPGKRAGVAETMWFNVPVNFVLE